nr:MAG TPA_asm: Terminase large subunit [Caudoviricetes sp.]
MIATVPDIIAKAPVTLLQSPMHQLECLNIVDEIIDGMDDKGILELMQGSGGDLDWVLDNLMKDTYQVMYTGDPNIDFAPKYTDRLSQSIEETLRTRNLTYFITSVMPDFQLSWHHLEWGDLVHRYNKLCINAARDHGKSYYFSNAYCAWKLYSYAKPKSSVFSARPTKSNSNRGYLFSFSLQQSVDLMEILKGTIESNDILKDRLFPDSRNSGAWASTNIVCRNGARLTCKGFGSSVRGAHPYWIVVDDGLKDNVIYSALQRQKSIDYFHAVIMNMLVPGGQIVVVGTPFHASDLYGDLRSKSKFATHNKNGWFVIEYPAIFPDGRILWPQRWSFFDLMDKKSTQGNIIFSRENLCRPITNEASIFPLKVLERSLVRMENYTLVRNRDDFPIKFNKVVVGCDFAISANVGSDYTVFTVWGVDDETGERWLLHFYRDKGKTFHEQMQILRGINARFRPDSMVMEQNTFQQIFVQESDKQGLPVIGHTTGIDKYDLKTGWPGLAIDFERGKIHIPIGDKYSQDVKDLIFSDLGSVAFTDKGLESVGEHDDISSSFWLAKLGANLITTGFKYTFL